MKFILNVPQIISILKFIFALKDTFRKELDFALKVSQNKIIFSTFSHEEYAEVTVEADVEGEALVALPRKLFQDLLRKVKTTEVACELQGHKLRIITDRGVYEIQGYELEKEFPSIDSFSQSFTVVNKDLKTGVEKTSFAVSKNPLSPTRFLSLKSVGDKLEVVGTDGYRLSMCCVPCSGIGETQLLVNPSLLKSYCAFLPPDAVIVAGSIKDEKKVKDVVVFKTEFSKLAMVTGSSFLRYSEVLERYRDYNLAFRVDRKSLLGAITRAVGIGNSCVMRLEDGNIRIGANKDEISYSEYVPITLEKEGTLDEICFNPEYVLEFLREAEEDEVLVKLNGENNPIWFEDTSLIYVMMPLKNLQKTDTREVG